MAVLKKPNTKVKRSRTNKQDVIAARRARVAEFVLAGFTQRRIADTLGVSVGIINRDIKAIREEWKKEQSALGNEVIRDIQRLDTMIQPLWTKAARGDDRAVKTIADLIEKKAKILDYVGQVRNGEVYGKKEEDVVDPGILLYQSLGVGKMDNDQLQTLIGNLILMIKQ